MLLQQVARVMVRVCFRLWLCWRTNFPKCPTAEECATGSGGQTAHSQMGLFGFLGKKFPLSSSLLQHCLVHHNPAFSFLWGDLLYVPLSLLSFQGNLKVGRPTLATTGVLSLTGLTLARTWRSHPNEAKDCQCLDKIYLLPLCIVQAHGHSDADAHGAGGVHRLSRGQTTKVSFTDWGSEWEPFPRSCLQLLRTFTEENATRKT